MKSPDLVGSAAVIAIPASLGLATTRADSSAVMFAASHLGAGLTPNS